MISYEKSKTILKKAKIKIKEETIKSVNSLNRLVSSNVYSNINFNESDLFFIKSNNTRHNIFGLWSINLLDKLEKDLNNGERKVELWANNTGVKIINMEFSNNNPFFNINTKEDLKKAEEILKND